MAILDMFKLRGADGKSRLLSEANLKGSDGRALVDLDRFYESKKDLEKDANVMTAIIEIVSKVSKVEAELKQYGEKKKDKITYLVNEKPNKWESAYSFKSVAIAESIIKGNSYIEIIRKGKKVESLRRLDFDKVNVITKFGENEDYVEDVLYYIVLKDEGELRGKENGEDLQANVDKGYARVIESKDVLHLKPFNYGNGVIGLSLLEYLEEDIEIEDDSKRFIRQFMKTGGNLGGILNVNSDGNMMAGEQKDEIRKEYLKQIQNYTGIVVTDAMVQFTPKEVSDKVVSSLLENKTVANKFAQMFMLPLHKMGVSTSNMSLAQLNHDFRNGTLAMYLTMLESEFNDKFYRVDGDYDSTLVYDLNSISQLTPEERRDLAKVLSSTGAGTINEIRDVLGLDIKDDETLNKHRVDLNKVDVKISDKYQLNKVGAEVENGESLEGGEKDGGV